MPRHLISDAPHHLTIYLANIPHRRTLCLLVVVLVVPPPRRRRRRCTIYMLSVRLVVAPYIYCQYASSL